MTWNLTSSRVGPSHCLGGPLETMNISYKIEMKAFDLGIWLYYKMINKDSMKVVQNQVFMMSLNSFLNVDFTNFI